MKKILYLIVFLVAALHIGEAQNTIDLSLLTGDWIGKEIADPDNDYKLMVGAELAQSEITHELHFLSSTTVFFKEPTTEGTYAYNTSSTNATVTIDGTTYTVLLVNQTELRLHPVANTTPAILYFNKVPNNGY